MQWCRVCSGPACSSLGAGAITSCWLLPQHSPAHMFLRAAVIYYYFFKTSKLYNRKKMTNMNVLAGLDYRSLESKWAQGCAASTTSGTIPSMPLLASSRSSRCHMTCDYAVSLCFCLCGLLLSGCLFKANLEDTGLFLLEILVLIASARL